MKVGDIVIIAGNPAALGHHDGAAVGELGEVVSVLPNIKRSSVRFCSPYYKENYESGTPSRLRFDDCNLIPLRGASVL